MSLNYTEKLSEFRNLLHLLFPKRKDAIMNLLDALSSYGHQCRHVVQLSTAPSFERQYSSITDAIAEGLPEANWSGIRTLVYQAIKSVETKSTRFIIDCTPNPRPHAQTLSDRTITHAPNPAPGNKPICVGHQYSVVVVAPSDVTQKDKHWVVPISAVRVPSHKKGNELGMQQLNDCIEDLNLTDELTISVADSLYGTQKCRELAVSKKNLVHIFRLRNNRNVFLKPSECESEDKSNPTKGRKQEYGDKMQLGEPSTHPECDEITQSTFLTRKGKTHTMTIKSWRDILLRGTAKFRSSEHPIHLIQISVTNEANEPVFKRPLWLGVLGTRRYELTLTEVQQAYAERYDIEHFYRFGKRNLLLDAYQTPEVYHEGLWWNLCCLAYVQLFLASGIVPSIPNPWERYLPEYKEETNESNAQKQVISSPSKTQRGFTKVLEVVGTPASPCVPRGNPQGRAEGDVQVKRKPQPVIFKSKKANPKEKAKESLDLTSEFTAKKSNPEKIDDLVKLVQLSLKKLQLTPTEFTKLLDNTS